MTQVIPVLLMITWLGLATPTQAQDARATFAADWAQATRLVDDRSLPEAEALLIRMEGETASAFGPDAPETLRVRSQRAEVVLGQRRWEEAGALAAPVYERALALFGPDNETTDESRLVVASAALRAGRVEEATPLLRASFDYLLASEGPDGGAADLAGLLATLYGRLGQPEEADAVLALVGGNGAVALANQMERRRAGGDLRGMVQVGRALLLRTDVQPALRVRTEIDVTQALLMLARGGDAAALTDAEILARAMVESRTVGGDPVALASAQGLLGEVLLFDFSPELGAARIEEGLAMQRLAFEGLRGASGPGHTLTIQSHLAYAMSLVAAERYEAGLAMLDEIEALATSQQAYLSPEQAAFLAMTQAGVRMAEGDPVGAYARLAEASAGFQAYALAPDRSGRARAYLADHGFVFRTQVAFAWTNAERMGR